MLACTSSFNESVLLSPAMELTQAEEVNILYMTKCQSCRLASGVWLTQMGLCLVRIRIVASGSEQPSALLAPV